VKALGPVRGLNGTARFAGRGGMTRDGVSIAA
jgi:hypothetical protein